MTAEHRSLVVRGLAPLAGFTFLTAALDVYAGNQLQSHNPISVAAISFTLAAVFFLGGDMLRRGVRASLSPLRTDRGDVVAINVTTAVTWLSMLVALKYLEPAVVTAVGLAIGPLFTVLLNRLLRPGSSVLPAESLVSVGIFILIGLMAWGSVTGHSGVGHLGVGQAVAGIALTLLTGVGSVANVVYSKRLSEAGHSPQSVLAVRFFLMVAATWALVAFIDEPGLAGAFVPSALIAVVGVALPLFLLQVGIKHTEPITASILMTLAPLCAFLLQLPDSRLRPAPLTLAAILGITVLVAIGIVARNRHDAAARQISVPVAAGSGPISPSGAEESR